MLMPLLLFAQLQGQKHEGQTCASDKVLLNALKDDPAQLTRFKQLQQDWQRYAQNGRNASLRSTVELPVVFHLVTKDGVTPDVDVLADAPESVTVAALNNTIDYLNERFAGENEAFDCSEPAGGPIRFCLAQQDDEGYTSPGYTIWNGVGNAVPHPVGNPVASTQIQATANYATEQYINVYILQEIEGDVTGYATLPSAHGSTFDGIHIEAGFLNTVTLIHEMGHYLGLFHTFGICSPDLIDMLDDIDLDGNISYNACSCDNDNCLYNGDMVCDTPPNRMNPQESDPDVENFDSCSGYNTCNTDDTATTFDDFNLTIDMQDDKMNYMDYNQSLNIQQNHFTPGQLARMCFMVDPDIGPRNSLLGGASCQPGCDPDCTLTLDDFTYELEGAQYENTIRIGEQLVLSPEVGDCNFTNYQWFYTDLDSPPLEQAILVPGSTTALLDTWFGTIGNYRLTLEAWGSGSCDLEISIDIKVIPDLADCPANIDASTGWDGWQRVVYHGGYLSDGSPEMGDPDPEDFGIVDQAAFDADPNFGTGGLALTLPDGVDQAVRVGRVIGDAVELPNSSAYYATYTFHPTPENSRIRIWYLGAKVGAGTPGVGGNFLTESSILPSLYGIEPHYQFSIQNTDDVSNLGGLHNQSAKSTRDRVGFGGYGAGYGVDINTLLVNGNSVDLRVQQTWLSREYDFSAYACDENSQITLTFYARTNSNTDGFDHAYAYFGVESCLPQIADPVVFDNPNVHLDCMATTNTADVTNCELFILPRPPGFDQNYIYGNFSNLQIRVSENGTDYVPGISQVDFFYGSAGGFSLCNDEFPIKYFELTYSTICGTYVDHVTVFRHYINQVDYCEDEEFDGGLNAGALEVQHYCPTDGYPLLELTDPCWLEPGEPLPEFQWQVLVGSTWRPLYFTPDTNDPVNTVDFPIIGTESYQHTGWQLLSELLIENSCTSFRRVSYQLEPYCGYTLAVPSEPITIQNLVPRSRFRPSDFDLNDICGLTNLWIEFDFSNAGPYSNEVDNQPYQCNPDLLENIGHPAGITNTLQVVFHHNTIGNVIDVISGSSSPVYFESESYWTHVPGDVKYWFDNVTEDFTSFFEEGDLLFIEYTGTMFGCDFSYFSAAIPISALPILSGQVGADDHACFATDDIEVWNVGDDVFPVGGEEESLGYFWQYSYSANFAGAVDLDDEQDPFSLTIPAETLLNSEAIVYVRRVYNGNSFCAGPGFSNPVAIVNSCFVLDCDNYEIAVDFSVDDFLVDFTISFPSAAWVPTTASIDFGDGSAIENFTVPVGEYNTSHQYPEQSEPFDVTIEVTLVNQYTGESITCTQTTGYSFAPTTGSSCYFDVYPPGGIIFDLDGNTLTITFDDYWDYNYTNWDVTTNDDLPYSQAVGIDISNYVYTHTFTQPGTYEARVVLEDNFHLGQGCDLIFQQDIYVQCPFSLQGIIWEDAEPIDGMLGNTESGISFTEVAVFEYDAGSFTEVASTMSNLDGKWGLSFNDFIAYLDKDYYIVIPQETASLNQLSLTEANVEDDSADSDFYELTIDGVAYYAYGPIDFSCDIKDYVFGAGFFKDCLQSRFRLTGKVWSDDNQSGTQNWGEAGIQGFPVTVFEVQGASYQPIAATYSDMWGNYGFTNTELTPQPGFDYYVSISDAALPPQLQITATDIGNDYTDSDFSAQIIGGNLLYMYGPIDFSCGSEKLDYDVGFFKKCLDKDFKITGTVWKDEDSNGLQGNGESGLLSIPVSVFEYAGSSFSYTASSYSNGAGDYDFLPEDFNPDDYSDYFLVVAAADIPTGLELTIANVGSDDIDSDFVEVTVDNSKYYVFGPILFDCDENHFEIDLGLRPVCIPKHYNIHGTIWNDNNPKNSVQDAGEDGIANVTLAIYAFDGEYYQEGYITETNANGNWGATDEDFSLDPSLSYFVLIPQEEINSELNLVPYNWGPDDIDSDFWQTVIGGKPYYVYGPIAFDCDTYDYDFDIGFAKSCLPHKHQLTGTAWYDINPKDGAQGELELGLADIRVQVLAYEEGRYFAVAATETDLGGHWSITSNDFRLEYPAYYLAIAKSDVRSTYELTASDATADDIDSDFTERMIEGQPYYTYGPIDFTCEQIRYDYDIGFYSRYKRAKASEQEDVRAVSKLQIVPNPAQRSTRIMLPTYATSDVSIAEVNIYNLLGEQVYSAPIANGARDHLLEFEVSQPSGVYLVEVLLGDQTIKSRLVLIGN